MSEMLGNQYFLTRNFSKAKEAYEKVLESEPNNDYLKKRLIICYTQTGEIKKAFEFFYEIVKKDIELITKTDIVADDCPCPELISRYGNIKPNDECSYDSKLMLGILWLYCNTEKSFEFFENLANEETSGSKIKEIRNLIKQKVHQSKEYHSQNN
ncbi:MAG: tetratricopeptide repeat protein [Ignavibacterium sp.]